MRIVQVVTLVSTDGAFGGPLRVALNQVAELRRRGHDVDLVAGWTGPGEAPAEVDGVPVTVFRARQLVPGAGFSGLVSPRLVAWLRRTLPTVDVLHCHTGRDLIGLSALAVARTTGAAVVVQTHGMIAPDSRPRARLLDALLVRRLVGAAAQHLVLTAREVQDLPAVLRRPLRLHRLMNGVPLASAARTQGREVLYCARLHARKRPLAFVEMAQLLLDRGVVADFRLVGPDEGELPAVLQRIDEAGLAESVAYEGSLPYDEVLPRMRRAAVYVLPSVDEPFPMSLLEALSLGVPSVCTDSCGISDLLRQHRAAVVTDGSAGSLAAAVAGLLADPAGREALGSRGRRAAEEVFSLRAVVDDLVAVYERVVQRAPEPGEPG